MTDMNIFAACYKNGLLIAKRIGLDASIQSSVKSVFEEQEIAFRENITEEVDFNGAWKPDGEQILTIPIPEQAEIFEDTILSNAVSIPMLDLKNFANEGIKALFLGTKKNGKIGKVLIQRFTVNQTLNRKFCLLQNGNAFRKMTENAFALGSKLTCIIESGKIKFKSQHLLRSIIDMQQIYRDATDQEVHDFASQKHFEVTDVKSFVKNADHTTRKLISAINHSDILQNHSAKKISDYARAVGIDLRISKNKIVMPDDKAGVKNLLRFLDDSVYKATLTDQVYITNSKKPL